MRNSIKKSIRIN